jgi:hypothetical protein
MGRLADAGHVIWERFIEPSLTGQDGDLFAILYYVNELHAVQDALPWHGWAGLLDAFTGMAAMSARMTACGTGACTCTVSHVAARNTQAVSRGILPGIDDRRKQAAGELCRALPVTPPAGDPDLTVFGQIGDAVIRVYSHLFTSDEWSSEMEASNIVISGMMEELTDGISVQNLLGVTVLLGFFAAQSVQDDPGCRDALTLISQIGSGCAQDVACQDMLMKLCLDPSLTPGGQTVRFDPTLN